MSRLIVFALVSCAFIPSALRAQDPLADARARQEIATQKMTAQVADAISASRRLEKADPGEAKYLLQRSITQVKDSSDLTFERRNILVRQLQVRLNEVNDSAANKRATQNVAPYSEKPRPRTADEPKGKGVSSIVKDFQDPAKNALKIAQDGIRTRELNIVKIGSSLEKSPPYPTDDRPVVVSREDYLRALERGKPTLTEKEAALLKALNSVMTPAYDGEKFGTVIQHIQDKTGVTMIFDQAAVEDVRLDYDDVVAFKAPGKMSVRTIIKKVLADKGLTYVIKEGALQVMTQKKAREMVVIRSYPVSDLVQPSTMARMYGPFMAQAQTMQNVQQLIMLIQNQTDPSYWEPNGPGRIGYYGPSQSLVITASAEMHYQLGGMGLLGLR